MDANDADPKGSKPYQVYRTNVLRLVDLARSPRPTIAGAINSVHQVTREATVGAEQLGEFLREGRQESYDSARFQREAASLMSNLETTSQRVTELDAVLKTDYFLRCWMVVMLVTFAEAYLEDVLELLLASGLRQSSLPPSIGEDMKRKWVRDILRSGKPHEWIKQLERFGVAGYSPTLADQMVKIWKRRHQIAHSAEPEIDRTALQEFLDATKIVNDFVQTTDRFVVAISPACP